MFCQYAFQNIIKKYEKENPPFQGGQKHTDDERDYESVAVS
jgi:hypothetical protein